MAARAALEWEYSLHPARLRVLPIAISGSSIDVEKWAFEAGTPNVLFRRGFTKASLMPGTVVKVDGYQAKDGTRRANGRDLTFADGKKMFMGSSGTGAPYELARPGDATEKPR